MLTQPVRFGALILIGLNLLMAFGSIWVFIRMAPAIEVIIDRNDVSLEACEEMLAALVSGNGSEANVDLRLESFDLALERARRNITEDGEAAALATIAESYRAAFQGDRSQLARTVRSIRQLGHLNRAAMAGADARARQLGYAGAWGVVFMASLIFLVGILFLRSMKKNLLDPLLEIELAVDEFRGGNPLRRCTLNRPPKRIRVVFNHINGLLDRCPIPPNAFGGPSSKDLP